MSNADKPRLNVWVNVDEEARPGSADRGWNQQRDRREEEEARLQARADAVEFLDVVLEAAEKK